MAGFGATTFDAVVFVATGAFETTFLAPCEPTDPFDPLDPAEPLDSTDFSFFSFSSVFTTFLAFEGVVFSGSGSICIDNISLD